MKISNQLQVSTPYGTFNRTTVRSYTHVVVGQRNYRADLEQAKGKGTWAEYHAERIADRVKKLQEDARNGLYDRGPISWCSRLELAYDAVVQANCRGFINVEIYEVKKL